MSEEATIEIYRQPNWLWRRSYYYGGFDIYLDGSCIGYLDWREPKALSSDTKIFTVPIGQHSLSIKGSLWQTETLNFSIGPAETKFFECSIASWLYYAQVLVILALVPMFFFKHEFWFFLIFSIIMYIVIVIISARPGATWHLKEL